MPDTKDSAQSAEWLVGLAIYGTALAGVSALTLAFFAFFAGRLQEAATCLVGAAIAFGMLANALLRA